MPPIKEFDGYLNDIANIWAALQKLSENYIDTFTRMIKTEI